MLLYDCGRLVLLGVNGLRWEDPKAIFKVMLLKDGYLPDRGHTEVGQCKKWELVGGGYERQVITKRELVASGQAGRVDFIADPTMFTRLYTDASYRHAIVYRDDGASASTLIGCIDMQSISLRGISKHMLDWDGKAPKQGRVLSIY